MAQLRNCTASTANTNIPIFAPEFQAVFGYFTGAPEDVQILSDSLRSCKTASCHNLVSSRATMGLRQVYKALRMETDKTYLEHLSRELRIPASRRGKLQERVLLKHCRCILTHPLHIRCRKWIYDVLVDAASNVIVFVEYSQVCFASINSQQAVRQTSDICDAARETKTAPVCDQLRFKFWTWIVGKEGHTWDCTDEQRRPPGGLFPRASLTRISDACGTMPSF